MRRLWPTLIALLGLTLLAAQPVSAAVAASIENRISGSQSGSNNLVGIDLRLSEEAVREKVALAYELASDDAVAARTAAAPEALIGRIAQQHADSGVQGLAPYLSQAELSAVLSGSRATPAILGQGVHRATAASLQASHPDQYIYFPRAPYDFVHVPTGQALELTTFGQAASHVDRGANLVLYNLAN